MKRSVFVKSASSTTFAYSASTFFTSVSRACSQALTTLSSRRAVALFTARPPAPFCVVTSVRSFHLPVFCFEVISRQLDHLYNVYRRSFASVFAHALNLLALIASARRGHFFDGHNILKVSALVDGLRLIFNLTTTTYILHEGAMFLD